MVYYFYSFAFKLETISILFIFLARNLDTKYDTKNVPIKSVFVYNESGLYSIHKLSKYFLVIVTF